MKKVVTIALFISSPVLAGEDLTCEKKPMNDHVVHCKSKKDVEVTLLNINGGECAAPAFHKRIVAGGSFDVPGTKECFHTRSIMMNVDRMMRLFAPL